MPESPTILPPLYLWTHLVKWRVFFEEEGLTLAVKPNKAFDNDFYDIIHEVIPSGRGNLIAAGNRWWWTKVEYLDALVERLGADVSKVTFRRMQA